MGALDNGGLCAAGCGSPSSGKSTRLLLAMCACVALEGVRVVCVSVLLPALVLPSSFVTLQCSVFGVLGPWPTGDLDFVCVNVVTCVVSLLRRHPFLL